MSWNQSVVTNAGVGLLNESLSGHTLTIESAVGGAGTLTEEELAAATDVVDQKQVFSLLGIEDIEGGKRVGIQITNNGVSESYILHQIGVQARLEYEEAPLTLLIILQDEHGVEIPTEAENPDWLFEIYAVISISNKANITVNIDTSAIASVSYVQRTFVPMTRKINGKVLSGDVTLTGDDIKTSAEDNTPVSAALSNKVSVPQPILPGTDLNVVTTPGMYYSENASDTGIQNAPNNDAAFSLLVENTGAWGGRARKQTYTPYNKNIVLTRILTFSGAGLDQIWTPWVQIAAATSQQEYDLLLENGIENNANTKSVYFVDPFGVVTVSVNVHGTNTLSAGTIIARIPEGFRPKRPNTVCVNTNAFLSFDPSGNIIVYTVDSKPLDANKWLVANVSFLAAGN